MKMEDFQSMMQFAVNATRRKSINDIDVKILLTLSSGKNKSTVVLDIKEIGFYDKSGTIYIEV